jgi:hypothetical protein
MISKNYNPIDLNELFEHLEIMHSDLLKLEHDNSQLEIEKKELIEKIIVLERNNADKDYHILRMHKELDDLEKKYLKKL